MGKYLLVFLLWNVIVMFIFGLDKKLAKERRRRISEANLLMFSFALGAYGAMFGMVLYNHKTSKPKFRFLVPLAVVFWSAALLVLRRVL